MTSRTSSQRTKAIRVARNAATIATAGAFAFSRAPRHRIPPAIQTQSTAPDAMTASRVPSGLTIASEPTRNGAARDSRRKHAATAPATKAAWGMSENPAVACVVASSGSTATISTLQRATRREARARTAANVDRRSEP